MIGADKDATTLSEEVADFSAALIQFTGPNHDANVLAVAGFLKALPRYSAYADASKAPQMHLITVASRWQAGLHLMQSTASLFGFQPKVLGMGDGLLVSWGKGLGRKVHHVTEYLRTLSPGEMVLFVDAYDCVLMGHPEMGAYYRGLARAILREPKDPAEEPELGDSNRPPPPMVNPDLNAPFPESGLKRRLPTILLSAESFCMNTPEAEKALPMHIRSGKRFPCINSGGYMGPAGDILALLGAVDWHTYMSDDQAGFYTALALSRSRQDLPLVAVDHDNEMFLTMLGVDYGSEMLLEAGRGWRLAGTPRTSHPVIWHYPSYFKRMSVAVGLLTGRDGTRGSEKTQSLVAIAWGVGMLAFALGCWGGSRLRSDIISRRRPEHK